MKRKKFLLISVVAVAAIATPVVYFNRRHKERDKPLEQPWILARFCGEEEIRAIGTHYRAQVPGENKKERLIELLLADGAGQKISSTSDSAVSKWIDKQIQQEFKDEKTIVAKGWVISVTEARQCALFSMT
ncbi:MAG: hypothetical protein ACXWWD_10845 [Chitinophagaceae bacterium]